MKKLCLLSIFISLIKYGSTSSEGFYEDQPESDLPTPKEVNVHLKFSNEENVEVTEPSKEPYHVSEKEPIEYRIGKDYFRIDSMSSSKESRWTWLKQRTAIHNDSRVQNVLDPKEKKQYQVELAAGDMTQLLGTNRHTHQAAIYPDLSRRFVPQYPYREIISNINQDDVKDNSLTPKRAPPELVLAVAKESALLEAGTPKNPTEEIIKKDILRTGEYWNSFWQEDVDPKKLLRTEQRTKLKSVMVKLSPGTEIYDIVTKLKQLHPKLLYVINKHNKH